MLKIFFALYTCLLLFTTPVFAGDIVGKVQQKYDSMQSFRADFVQVLTNNADGQSQKRSGTISFQQPGLIRWETVEPERELLIVGKDAIWDYFADEELAIKYLSSQIFDSKTMLRFISGKTRLDEDFQVEEIGTKNGIVELRLTPFEPEPGLVSASAWVESESGLLKIVELIDFYGNSNRLELDNVVIDADMPDQAFEFTPPEGTDVQDNTLQ